MANQGYLGRKTHPARATNKARALFFSLYLSLFLCSAVCLSVCPSLCVCSPVGKLLSQGDTKVQRAWLPHYGIKAVSSANTRKSSSQKNSKAHTCVCVCVWECDVCVFSVTDVCYRLKTCVTDNPARQKEGATLSGNGQLTPGHRIN